MRRKLQDTAEDLAPEGKDDEYGYGLVDAEAAVEGAVVDPPSVSWLARARG